MTHWKMPAFSAAILAVVLGTTNAFAERDVARRDRATATGDWTCQLGEGTVGTLSVRVSSYVLSRSGTSMAGEYQQIAERVIVTNGPLRGLGVESGILVDKATERSLEFPTVSGAVLSCREVL